MSTEHNNVNILVISDTHQQHQKLNLTLEFLGVTPDILVHCGDYSNSGSWRDIDKFNTWLGSLTQIPHKVIIAGNHEMALNRASLSEIQNRLSNAIYLQDSGCEIIVNKKTIKFWGTPWTPPFFNWAFMKSDSESKRYFEQIPEGLDILITHGPPQGLLDLTDYGSHVGSQTLATEVSRAKPTYHVFGHIHHSYGFLVTNNTTFINAAVCDEKYKPTNAPVLITI